MPPNTSSRSPRCAVVDPDLERLQLLGDARREVLVVGGEAGDQAAVGGVHRGQQLGLGVHQTTESSGPNGSAWCSDQLAGGASTQAGATYAEVSWPSRKRPAASEPRCRGSPPPRTASSNCSPSSAALRAQITGRSPARAAGRPVSSTASGWPKRRLERRTGRYISRNPATGRRWTTIPRVGGAALLGVLEALAQVLGEQLPLGEVPDAPGVEALLLEEVPTAGSASEVAADPAVGPAADEGQRADLRVADQRVAQLAAAPESRVTGSPARP